MDSKNGSSIIYRIGNLKFFCWLETFWFQTSTNLSVEALTRMQCVEDDESIWETDAKDVAGIQVPEWDLKPGDEAGKWDVIHAKNDMDCDKMIFVRFCRQHSKPTRTSNDSSFVAGL